jgi:hypothetical protein
MSASICRLLDGGFTPLGTNIFTGIIYLKHSVEPSERRVPRRARQVLRERRLILGMATQDERMADFPVMAVTQQSCEILLILHKGRYAV